MSPHRDDGIGMLLDDIHIGCKVKSLQLHYVIVVVLEQFYQLVAKIRANKPAYMVRVTAKQVFKCIDGPDAVVQCGDVYFRVMIEFGRQGVEIHVMLGCVHAEQGYFTSQIMQGIAQICYGY